MAYARMENAVVITAAGSENQLEKKLAEIRAFAMNP